jgi:Uncharacterized conserved protein (DUF2304).
MTRLLHVTTALSVVLILLVLVSVRRAHIRVEYSVAWLSAAIILLVLSLNRGLLYWLAGVMGIDYPPVALLMIVFFVFLVVFYRFSIRISDMKDSNIALAQRVAILEYQLRSSHEEQEKPSNE